MGKHELDSPPCSHQHSPYQKNEDVILSEASKSLSEASKSLRRFWRNSKNKDRAVEGPAVARVFPPQQTTSRDAQAARTVEATAFRPWNQTAQKRGALAPAVTRYLVLPLVLVLSVITLGSADTEARYQDLGHKFMCVCGCSEILIECNHVGCPDSDRMLAELRAAVGRGDSTNAILTAFQDKYGPTALAAPMLTKFNIVAWVVPPALLVLGLFGTWILIRRWRTRMSAMPAVEEAPLSDDLREKIRRETEV
jgi:cytochrome c-type biogenesis protein CcmH